MKAPLKHGGRLRCAPTFAFTLVELLVVIAIIALLISILLPALETARKQAKPSVCMAHIKNITTSGQVYAADDPNDMVIPVHPLMFQQDPQQPQLHRNLRVGRQVRHRRDRLGVRCRRQELLPW